VSIAGLPRCRRIHRIPRISDPHTTERAARRTLGLVASTSPRNVFWIASESIANSSGLLLLNMNKGGFNLMTTQRCYQMSGECGIQNIVGIWVSVDSACGGGEIVSNLLLGVQSFDLYGM